MRTPWWNTVILLCITFFPAKLIVGIGWSHVRMQEHLWVHQHQRNEQFSGTYQPVIPGLPEPVQEQYLTQPMDHFDPQLTLTYKQRFWCNSSFWTRPDGPVFLFIGGEGALNGGNVVLGEHVDLARKYQALIFAVEHRFYGKSINPDGLELKSLQYLSSQQALADLASFHVYATSTYNLTENNRWISFGGSYPGALSAWFRIKYPHLVHAAVSTSAPVNATLDFVGFNDVVARSLEDQSVHGSKQCVENVRLAFKQVDELLQTRQFNKLETDFRTCDNFTSEDDMFMFTENLADPIKQTVQYNSEIKIFSIETVCKEMTAKNSPPYESLKKLNQYFQKQQNVNCTESSWKGFMRELSDDSGRRWLTTIGYRQWIYQTCTQFGYYQSCEPNTLCPFSQLHTLEKDLEICQQVFGIQPSVTANAVKFTNSYYGGGRPQGSRILFVNGLVDPWHALGVLKNLSLTESAVVIDDGAHCSNMVGPRKDDRPDVILARQKIDKQVGQWLMKQ